MKVMTIVGTRPEIIKMSRVIPELDEFTEHTLVHTGQNFDYELNKVFFEDFELRLPDYNLEVADASAAKTIANVISRTDEVLEKVKPDALLVYGDTNSCLSVISAKRRKIPIFHMEAGNRCFDQRVPEEINRKIIDHTSDINMTITEHARKYLVAEGIKPETIFKIGSSIPEILKHYDSKICRSDVLDRLELTSNNFFLVSIHREENVDSHTNFLQILETLNELARAYGKQVIVSTHPRTAKKLVELAADNIDERIIFMKPMGYFDYLGLQKAAICVLSDSGTITEESAILGFPAVMLRQSHERPEGVDEGVLIMSGLSKKNVLNSIEIVIQQSASRNIGSNLVDGYSANFVSKKVLKIIMSYTEYVRRTVWCEY